MYLNNVSGFMKPLLNWKIDCFIFIVTCHTLWFYWTSTHDYIRLSPPLPQSHILFPFMVNQIVDSISWFVEFEFQRWVFSLSLALCDSLSLEIWCYFEAVVVWRGGKHPWMNYGLVGKAGRLEFGTRNIITNIVSYKWFLYANLCSHTARIIMIFELNKLK